MSPRGRPSRKQRARQATQSSGPAAGEVRVLAVGEALAGGRLDRTVAALLPELSRARARELIEEGLGTVDGRTGAAAERPRAGARLEVRLEARGFAVAPAPLDLPVLWEDDALLVIDKPAGVAVHPGAHLRGPTVLAGLLHRFAGSGVRPGIAHRLDQETSGCLAVAKSEPALRGLLAAFRGRTVEKRYRALVHGAPPDAGELDTLFGPAGEGQGRRLSSKVAEGQRALTRFRVLGRGGGAALLDVELLTGRTHQIRVHFADAGFPLLGDGLYGGAGLEAALPPEAPARRAAEALGRQGLHAFQLALPHPISGARIACTAPLPADLRAALSLLGIAGG